jgi:hypothetical protein
MYLSGYDGKLHAEDIKVGPYLFICKRYKTNHVDKSETNTTFKKNVRTIQSMRCSSVAATGYSVYTKQHIVLLAERSAADFVVKRQK